MQTWGGARRRARWAVASTAVTALTASMLAAPVEAAVGPTRVVTVSPDDGVVLVQGLSHNDTYTVTVERGDVVIGSASGSPAGFGTFGALELNHPADLFAPFCWDGVTPQMAPGDVVRVTGPGVDDSVEVQDVDVLTYPTATTGPGGEPAFEVTGTLGAGLDPTNVDVFIRLDLNPPPPGGDDDNPEPVDDNTDDWRARTSDPGNDLTFSEDGSSWTATFTTGEMLEDVPYPVDDKVLAAAPAPRVLHAAYRVGTPVPGEDGGNESTIGLPPGAGEAVEGCPGTADSAIGYISPSVINVANQGSVLTVSGVSAAALVDVEVSGPGGGAPLADTVTVLPNGTWTTTFDGPLSGLEGELTVTASHDGGATTAPANRRTVLRDTVAPVAPVAIPSTGSFSFSMEVLLASTEAEIRYTEGDGTQAPPTATTGRRYTGPILMGQTTTLKAVAVDAAKNVGPVLTRTYTKIVPVVPPTTPAPPPPDAGAAAVLPLAPAMGRVNPGKPGGKRTATVRWRAPLANGVAVEGYQVRALKLRPGRSAKVRKVRMVDADRTKKRMALPRGRYKFQVRALGGNGTSRWSERSAKVRPR